MSAPKRKPALTAEQPETVETIRAQLVALKAERTALDRLPLGPTDVAEAVDRSLKALSDAWDVRLDTALSRIAGGAYTANEAIEMALNVHQGQRIDAVALVGLSGPAALRDALIMARLDGKLITGPSAAERAARKVEIESLAHRLQVEEERLIVEAENAGTPIPRRDDCDIGIVLAYAGSDVVGAVADAPEPTSKAELDRQQTAALRKIATEKAARAAEARAARSEYMERGRE